MGKTRCRQEGKEGRPRQRASHSGGCANCQDHPKKDNVKKDLSSFSLPGPGRFGQKVGESHDLLFAVRSDAFSNTFKYGGAFFCLSGKGTCLQGLVALQDKHTWRDVPPLCVSILDRVTYQ